MSPDAESERPVPIGRHFTFVHPGAPEADPLERYPVGREAGKRIYREQLADDEAASALRRHLDRLEEAGALLCFEMDRAPEVPGGIQFTLVGFDRPPLPHGRGVVKCRFEEGILAGILEEMSGTVFFVEEVQCRGGGAPACLFTVAPIATF